MDKLIYLISELSAEQITHGAKAGFNAFLDREEAKCDKHTLHLRKRLCKRSARNRSRKLMIGYLRNGMSRCDDNECREKLKGTIRVLAAAKVSGKN